MGVNSSGDEDTTTTLETHQETLNTDNITFVDALNSEISTVLENTPNLQYDYVLGDVSDYGVSGNGHAHFDLVHEDSTIHCVIFSHRLHSFDITIDDGTHIAVKGELSYYAANGSVSLIVEDFVEVGEGNYQQTYQENKRILEEDGLLSEKTKQSLPEFPRRIGLITSVDSDAREDAVTSIHSRHPDVDLVINHTTVQGDDAMLSMMQAISELDDNARIDVIVLTRGGGSEKDLRVFNETPLCRVIHNTTTPFVVGVGHENDRTLADEVADKRVMTPTYVGEIVPKKEELETELRDVTDRLDRVYERTVQTELKATVDNLDTAYEQQVDSNLTTFSTDLDHAFEALTSERLTALETELKHALESFEQQKSHEKEKVRELTGRLNSAYQRTVQTHLEGTDERLDNAYKQHVTSELATSSADLDYALESFEQQKVHEEEKEAVAQEYSESQRRQQITIAVLVILVLLLLGILLLNL
ncbi:exodeoxyribonuclease VII large subunit [Halostagnicola kamekurae]|uniref:Exodeoxyribonuclease VII large subunit n=1 Tax=Halostagnicola kamekurae TaxID=619731 RepID=A0A1I6V7J0_9EURY|nr:exodeoxyribonuclease VII large subunit [Halostagnicola kamekurae]SFT09604.1 Exodeoxyribonuclease VII large subunit [Halostagnicola kamekurae]